MIRLLNKFLKNSSDIDARDRDKALEYIDAYWERLKRTHTKDQGTLVGLPHPYIVPSATEGNFKFEEQYYWDSYFTALGLSDPKHQPLVEGMLDNLVYLFKRFAMIPNASRMYFTSRSQPPLLTTFIFHVYDTYDKDVMWLHDRMKVAEEEYEKVWMHNEHPQWHNVYKGLSRYYDVNVLHDLAEAESGWDMTTRFDRQCLDFLPVDLNALLYKYETDFARAASLHGDMKKADMWEKKAAQRKNAMDQLMWGKVRGFYFDYNFERKSLGDVWSLAGYYTMWAGMATPAQAERLVANLAKFEKDGGLTTTTRPLIDTSLVFGSLKAQWAYPNGWAPLHYIVVEGLRRYGYEDEARRIALKWSKVNIDWFMRHGHFQEKYNVVNVKKKPVEGVYPSQTGFGWTNAVLVRFLTDFNL